MALNWRPSETWTDVFPIRDQFRTPASRARSTGLDGPIYCDTMIEGAEVIALVTDNDAVKLPDPATVAGGVPFQIEVSTAPLLETGSVVATVTASAEGHDAAVLSINLSTREARTA